MASYECQHLTEPPAWISLLRNNNVIVLALALYCLRLLGYSFINSPMESLFFEVVWKLNNTMARWLGLNSEDIDIGMKGASNDLSYFQLSRYPVGPKTLIFRFWSRLGTLCWWLPRWLTPRTTRTSVPWQASRWHDFQRALDVIFNSCSCVTICMCCRELWGLSTLEWGKLLGAWWVDLPSRSWVWETHSGET